MRLEEVGRAAPDKSCRTHGGVALLSPEKVAERLKQLGGWALAESRLSKTYRFADPRAALAFVHRVCALAEAENHHPELTLWKREVRIELWTHKSDGLTELDFYFAGKCDPLERG
ncbi:4a-hydroxytetrahydrobiopterin dehydratase [Sorangium sp. So ce302]|uniref:4a-hydroxytetrahydrobiopterin dehydratase n=1 Tax=unclassified Sorangium TaxID=2621164 RepID=UPI003F5D67D4